MPASTTCSCLTMRRLLRTNRSSPACTLSPSSGTRRPNKHLSCPHDLPGRGHIPQGEAERNRGRHPTVDIFDDINVDSDVDDDEESQGPVHDDWGYPKHEPEDVVNEKEEVEGHHLSDVGNPKADTMDDDLSNDGFDDFHEAQDDAGEAAPSAKIPWKLTRTILAMAPLQSGDRMLTTRATAPIATRAR